MLFDVLLLSILIGLLRRGSFKNLSEISIKNIGLIFLSFAIRYLPLMLKGSLFDVAIRYNIYIAVISYILLLVCLFSNLHIKGMWMVALGVFLNFAVITLNGGKMPVSLWAVGVTRMFDLKPQLFDPNYLYHVAINSATRLSFLGDVIPIPPPYPKPRIFSLGDLAMGIGLFFIIQQAMLKKKLTSGKIL